GWAFLSRYVANRSAQLELRVQGGGLAWSLRWNGPGGVENGQWLDLAAAGREVLEVRPSGRTKKEGATYRFWFYAATPLGTDGGTGRPIDIKALVATPGSAQGYWDVFTNGPG